MVRQPVTTWCPRDVTAGFEAGRTLPSPAKSSKFYGDSLVWFAWIPLLQSPVPLNVRWPSCNIPVRHDKIGRQWDDIRQETDVEGKSSSRARDGSYGCRGLERVTIPKVGKTVNH